MNETATNPLSEEVEIEESISDSNDIELDVREALAELEGQEAVDTPEEVVKAVSEGESAPEETQEVVETEEEPPIAPPGTWKADGKEEFMKLPRTVQKEIARREADRETKFHEVHRSYRQNIESLGDFEALEKDEMSGQFLRSLKSQGVSVAQALQSYIRAENLLNQDLMTGIETILQCTGVIPDTSKALANGLIKAL